MTGAAIVLLHVTLTGRDAFNAARNRALSVRAAWVAEGCLETVRARIDELLADSTLRITPSERWSALDKPLAAIIDSLSRPAAIGARPSPRAETCAISMEAVGSRLDLNTARDADFRNALGEVLGVATGAELADAIADWRDLDDDPRPMGAERGWYVSRQRVSPRNGAIADVQELALLRGLDDSLVLATARDVVGVEQGLISLNNAPAPVLKTIPGIGVEAADALVQTNSRGQPITDLIQFSSTLSQSAADSLRARFPDIVRLSVLEPVAWTLRANSTAGWPAVTADLELRMTRMGTRTAVVRRRSWR